MKIQEIEISNYKAFLGTHKIKVGGKNLFIYGENGSGKSSLYYALKDFFQSSVEDIDLKQLENIFVSDKDVGKTSIKVTFNPNSGGKRKNQVFRFSTSVNDTRKVGDTSIRDGNCLKSFLTYKHLLGVHHIKKDDDIDIFNLLVRGVLKHFKYAMTKDKELQELWTDVTELLAKDTSREYKKDKKQEEVDAAIKLFNDAFGELFDRDSAEYLLKHAGPFLEKFNHNLELSLKYDEARPTENYDSLAGARVGVSVKYAKRTVAKPHLFLNEARLSAMAISLYLGMVKRHAQGIPCKVLFLDDIFIGLDIGNRLPLLKMLEEEFSDYQIILTTYDKPWYEYARCFLEGKTGWKAMEFYAQTNNQNFDVPVIFDDQSLLDRAEKHLKGSDYKAAAVYVRAAFEKGIRGYCEKMRKEVVFKSKLKDHTTDDFWRVMNGDLTIKVRAGIEKYRNLVLNPFSHYNTEKHEIRAELVNAIQAVKYLEANLRKLIDMAAVRHSSK